MTILYSRTIQNTTLAQNALQLRAWQFIPTASGAANKITLWSTSAGKNFKLGIYTKAVSDRPAVLLATSINCVSVAGGQVVATFPAPPTLTSGTPYWVSFVTDVAGFWTGADSSVFPTRATGSTLSLFSDILPDPWVHTTAAATAGIPYLIVESTVASISSVDDLQSGNDFTVIISDSAYAATVAEITDGVVTKTVAVSGALGEFTGTAPQLVDGETSLNVGTVSIRLYDGSDYTASANTDYSVWYFHPDEPTLVPFTTIPLASVGEYSLSTVMALSPPWAINTSVSFDATKSEINDAGEYEGNEYGQYYVLDRDPDTKITRLITVDCLDAGATSTGLTVRGLTDVGASVTGLSVRGLGGAAAMAGGFPYLLPFLLS